MRLPKHPIRSLRYRARRRRRDIGLALRRTLAGDAVVVEAGAHDGSDTVWMAEAFGHVHAFEPVPDVYERLVAATAHLPNVSTWPTALGSEESVAPMFVGRGGGDASSSLLAPKEHLAAFPTVTFEETVEVHVTTLSAWARSNGIERIDGLWLDMQGYELAALKAAGVLLARLQAIVLEVSAVELYEGAPLWPEVREWLDAQGFRIEHERWDTDTFGNALAVRSPR